MEILYCMLKKYIKDMETFRDIYLAKKGIVTVYLKSKKF